MNKKVVWIFVVIGIFVIIYTLSGDNEMTHELPSLETTSSSVAPKPTLIPKWNNMTYEDKIEYYQQMSSDYIEEHNFNQKTENSYSLEYYMLVRNSILQEARDKYSIAFRHKTRTNIEYLLVDLNTSDYLLLYERQYGRHYGKFKVLDNGNWKFLENRDPFSFDTIMQYKNQKLYYASGSETGFIECSIEEPLKSIL